MRQGTVDETYRRLLPALQQWVGWFALVRGERLGGVFPSYEAAARAWMALYGPVPALIRRIESTAMSAAATGSPAVDAVVPPVPTPAPAPTEDDHRFDLAIRLALVQAQRLDKRFAA